MKFKCTIAIWYSQRKYTNLYLNQTGMQSNSSQKTFHDKLLGFHVWVFVIVFHRIICH